VRKKPDFVGFIKLEGGSIKDGKIELTNAIRFLKGIDETLSYFIEKTAPEYKHADYSLQVEVASGSIWVYLIEITVGGLVLGMSQQLGANIVGDKKPLEILKASIKKLQSTAKISKHVEGIDRKKIESPKFEGNKRVGIPNSRGEYLWVTKEELDSFSAAPKNLYQDLVAPVSEGVDLSIGLKVDNNIIEEEIKQADKSFFSSDDADNEKGDTVLPELGDGEYVELDGELTRGNDRTNTFGFAYKGHIITCTLKEGRVKEHKLELFDKVRITGTVTRRYEGKVSDEEKKKPKIKIETITDLENNDNNQSRLL